MKVQGHDLSDGRTVVSYRDDVEAFLDANKRRFNEPVNRKNEMRLVIRIPLAILMKFREELGLDFLNPEHAQRIFRIVQTDPEYKYLRTTPGCYV